MNIRVTTRWVTLLLLAVMLLSLCSCELFANFNDGMTEEDYEYSEEAAERGEGLQNKFIYGLIAVLFFGVSALSFFSPETGWKIGFGWRYKNAEPSDAALFMERIGGGIGMAVAGIALFVVIVS